MRPMPRSARTLLRLTASGPRCRHAAEHDVRRPPTSAPWDADVRPLTGPPTGMLDLSPLTQGSNALAVDLSARTGPGLGLTCAFLTAARVLLLRRSGTRSPGLTVAPP